MELTNTTGFVGQLLVVPDRDGYEHLVAVLKGTFRIAGESCVPAEEQAELVAGDQFHGEPGASSIRYESDFAPVKPATDVVLVGHAYALSGRSRHVDVSLQVGKVGLAARVHGDRHWGYFLWAPRISGARPFEKIPLVYERAFGGAQPAADGKSVEAAEDRNPVGTGFVKKRRRSFVNGLALPNIEDPKKPLKKPGQRPMPVGFGVLGRHWQPRLSYLGTYDDAWQQNRMPLLPEDFDERAFCGAHPALQARPHLVGGEPVRARGVTPRGTLRFALPSTRPVMEAHFEGAWKPLAPVLDTVLLEPDLERVCLTWRARLNIHGRVRALRALRMKPGA